MLIGMEKDYLGHLALLSASQQLSIQILESEVYESPLLWRFAVPPPLVCA